MFDEVRAVPKKIAHKRGKPKRKDRGRISPEVFAEVWERDKGCCVLCGKSLGQAWTIEEHHIIFRSGGGTGEAWNVALACGPVTQMGTCHYKAHHTKAGRLAFVEYQERVLLPYYQVGAS